jgi:uncharacterized protein with HEPN domain
VTTLNGFVGLKHFLEDKIGREVWQYVAGMTVEAFTADERTRDAVMRGVDPVPRIPAEFPRSGGCR